LGYYIRVLGLKAEQPSLGLLRQKLKAVGIQSTLKLEAGTEEEWQQVVVAHPAGTEIAIVEYNPVVEGELGHDELMEFIAEVQHYRPDTASRWLKNYLSAIKAIYALQLLSGTDEDDGWRAVHEIQSSIWNYSGGILQSDGEGFTNEDGHCILWQFSDGASGTWNMAVLNGTNWTAFEMNLGDPLQRREFQEGKIPATARLL
jgi:hypothetical protein